MVSTRSTKRKSPTPHAQATKARPAKAPKTFKQIQEPNLPEKKRFDNIQVVLLDIEGTICPITFVKDTLFPYALSRLPAILSKHWPHPASPPSSTLSPYITAFPPEHRTSPSALEAHVRDLTARDVKVAYLKNLQGFLWEEGYQSGAYTTPVYRDVLDFLESWPGPADGINGTEGDETGPDESKGDQVDSKEEEAANDTGAEDKAGEGNDKHEGSDGNEKGPAANGNKPTRRRWVVAIYSSGSIFAQKLLFQHIQDPSSSAEDSDDKKKKKAVLDKREVVSAWFDTTNAGPKTETESYERIARELEVEPERVLFLSDAVKEVRAAVEAGMKSIIVVREGNVEVGEEERRQLGVVESFDELELEL